MSSLSWMAQHLATRFPEPTSQPRFNPRPPGVIRPGSATQHVLEFLRENQGRHWSHWEIVKFTGRSAKSVDHACIYLRAQGLIEAFQDAARNSRYLRYGIAKA